MNIDDCIAAVDQRLMQYCHEQSALAEAIAPQYKLMWDMLSDYIQDGGKRSRPRLVLLAYSASGGQQYDAIISVAAAWELLHTSLLIHDDIMDHDYTRHGKPNIAGRYLESYRDTHTGIDSEHMANSMALLVGDISLSGSYQIIITEPSIDTDQKVVAMQAIADAVTAVAGGQMLDIEASILPLTIQSAERVNKYKTAVYSFIGPLQAGAELADAMTGDLQALHDYGEAVGLGYQLADDLLGVFGDEQTTGKSSRSDLREGKRTMLIHEAMAGLSTSDQALLSAVLQGQSEDYSGAKQLIISSGAQSKINERIDNYLKVATVAADTLSWSDDDRTALLSLAHSYLHRQV